MMQSPRLLQISHGNNFILMNIVTNFLDGLTSNVQGSVQLTISLDSTEHQRTALAKVGGTYVNLPVYTGKDDISGKIALQLKNSTRYEHFGLKVFLIGLLEIYNDSAMTTEFTSVSKELEPAGYLATSKTYRFKFGSFDKEYESFRGTAGCVRYFIRVALLRNSLMPILTEQQHFAVVISEPSAVNPIVPTIMEIVFEDRLQIEFQLPKNAYSVKERLEGSVTFMTLRMPVNSMKLSIIRMQTLGTAGETSTRSKVLQTFQILDGCPQQTMVIPFRLCMRGVKNLTPSYKNIHNRLFVRHWLHLAIYDEDGRAYFKRTQITFYRK